MTIGVGGNTPEEALAGLTDMTGGLEPIGKAEFQKRLERAASLMREMGWQALLATAGTNMTYFTGTHWHLSDRFVGVLVFPDASMVYIAPEFEESTLRDFMTLEGPLETWLEHESPYALVADILAKRGIFSGMIGMDESAPFYVSNGVAKAAPEMELTDAAEVTAACRMIKSPAELAIIQRAMDMTLEVHKATASILREGITTTEVEAFIDDAHRKVGAPLGNFFVIVLFGEATAYPHGVKDPQVLKPGDMVLVDSGCQLHDYISDLTRTYVFGEPTERQREVWNHEKSAQEATFAAAQNGVSTGDLDIAARSYLEGEGYGPDYQVPGLPHRTGHGIGLDIHEWPYLVRGSKTLLAPGMCLSVEPMLCIYGEFGVRLEDHFYMIEDGSKWFTEPSVSIDDPFGMNP